MRGEERSFIRLSGGLITSHFANLLQDEEHGFEYARPETFVRPWREEDAPLQDNVHFLKQVREVWDHLRIIFDEKYRNIKAERMNAEDARKFWQRPILDALGFAPTYTKKQIVISDQVKYHFPYRGWFPGEGVPKPPVIHILPPGTDPDIRPSRGQPSPHDALQDCLNRQDATWALLMNETVIRILRDYHHTTVPGYIEFDLEGIFLNRSFPEFLALYRFCHASRFARNTETGKEPLEDYYEVSRQAGEKIGESLRGNVVTAIEELGNGFLDASLIEQLRGDREACQAYYQEILSVVYRIIFMLFAEQRGMLGVGGEHGDLFLEEYSITSLRERVDAFEGRDDRHTDLWEGLAVTFGMLEKGVPELGINAFDGLLFCRENEHFLKDARCRNTALMNTIRALTWTVPVTEGRGGRQRIHGRQRISYADLSVEEIGAIYESLLDYTPRITEGFEEIAGREYRPGEFMLDPRGSERKSTGSYYTNPDLIAELIKSALDPVISHRLSQAGPDPVAREKTLLSIRVCDPACGSGAFLIAAANRLGHELAKVRERTELPSAKEVQAARRDVLSHCIYGVDLNPMAVELAKVSLWINALVDDKPLSFLDHHIKCGNSLIGATPSLIAGGIPDEAYTPVEGDSKDVAARIKKANREQRQSKTFSEFEKKVGLADQCAERFAALIECAENNPEAVERKRREYERLRVSAEFERERWAADTWCGGFFWPLIKEQAEKVPTTETVRLVRSHGKSVLAEDLQNELRTLAEKYRFFHWYLEFPEVFRDGGFDCALGNPPWERIKIQEKEFFEVRDPEVAGARNAAERARKITALKQSKPALYSEFLAAKRASECESLFLRSSGRFPLTGKGDINTYTVFAEHARSTLSSTGRAGIIVPTGIATDATTAVFFGDLVDRASLVSLYDFENREKLFPIDSRMKFCLLTMAGSRACSSAFDLAFFLHRIDHLNDEHRHFTLTPEEIALINPNTKNCPIFRSKRDAEITKAVYRRVPVLIDENLGETGNPWGVSFQAMFHMANDSHLFRTREQMEEAGFVLQGNRFVKGEDIWLPLYEAKMFWQYDHRFGTFDGVEGRSDTHIPTPSVIEHANPEYLVMPFYWVNIKEFFTRNRNEREWNLVLRNISNTTNERTGIFSLLPQCCIGHSAPIIQINDRQKRETYFFYPNICSFIFDFIIRQKMGGTNFTYHIVKQLPALIPSTYTPALTNFIAPRVIELTYTAWDLEPFALDVLKEVGKDQWNKWFPQNLIGVDGRPKPFIWDEGRRFDLRCDLDALYFHLYEISRDDVDYIMETFPIVKRKDEAAYGIYRTKEVIIAKYDELAKEFVRVMRADLAKQEIPPSVFEGESECVEWKASAFWSEIIPREILDQNKSPEVQQYQTKASHYIIAKTIAGFMNTKGGYLAIGILEGKKGQPDEYPGIEADYPRCPDPIPDGFIRALQQAILKKFFPDTIYLRLTEFLTYRFLEKEGGTICIIRIRPSDEPIFLEVNKRDAFFIRLNGITQEISKHSEILDYCKKHFPPTGDNCLSE